MNKVMTMSVQSAGIAALWLLMICAGCQINPQVSFRSDVYPILEENCVDCHTPPRGKGYRESGFNMEDYKSLMMGTEFGPVIVPGNSKKSILNMLVEGRADSSMRMPHNAGEPLAENEIRILHLWVEQGAHDN